MVLMVQVKLASDNGSVLTTWVEKRPMLAPGSSVKLKGEDKWRRVEEVYDIEMDKDDLALNRNWDNNNYDKHEGLKLKK